MHVKPTTDLDLADIVKGGLRAQWGPTIRLALPVIFAELGWMAMSIVDTIMVGGLGAEAIGAVGLGGVVHFSVVIFGMGLLLGLDTLVSQAYGARRLDEGQRCLIQGLYLSAILTGPLMLLQFALADRLLDFGVTPEVAALSRAIMRPLAWGTLPLLLLGAFRRYLQAVGAVRPVMLAPVLGNLINWFGNWLLIRGHLGFPALGVMGSGWSTTWSRIVMAGVLVAATVLRERGGNQAFWQVPLGLDPGRMLRLIRLGLPAALQITLEVGVFAVATALAGRLDAASLAAHQIALNISSVTFMVPLGIASAGSVRVGHAIGRRDPAGAGSAGWAAIGLGVGVMAVAGVVLVCFPRAIASFFSDDPGVLATSLRLLWVAACFQLFDGLQVVTTGVLRGAGDTRTAMFTGLVAYWAIGLPVGAWLGLVRGWGVLGLWIGLSTGLIVTAIVLIAAWQRLVARIDRAEAASPSVVQESEPQPTGVG
jgi:MATE family multidrug resistance protein